MAAEPRCAANPQLPPAPSPRLAVNKNRPAATSSLAPEPTSARPAQLQELPKPDRLLPDKHVDRSAHRHLRISSRQPARELRPRS